MLTLGDINQKFPETMDGDLYSDFHKDVYGYRPRAVTFSSMEEFDRSWARLVEDHQDSMADEARHHAEAEFRFEERVEEMIALGAVDRVAAIEWIRQAEDSEDLDELEFTLYLTYGYLRR